MARFTALILGIFISLSAQADPVEMIFRGYVNSIKDAKTNTTYILEGHKARVETQVTVSVRGRAQGGMRQWMQAKLPSRLKAFFERENQGTMLVTRFKPIPFKLDLASIRCRRDDKFEEYRVCDADYRVSRRNLVDVPTGDGGEQKLSLQVLSPKATGVPVRIARAVPKAFRVTTGKPMLSQYTFSGLPQH